MKQRSLVIWGALLFGVVALGGVAYVLGPQLRASQREPYPDALPYAAVAMGVLGPLVGHVMRRSKPPRQSTLVLSLAVAELGAIHGAVMWMMTGAPLAMAGYLAGAVGLASLFPNDVD